MSSTSSSSSSKRLPIRCRTSSLKRKCNIFSPSSDKLWLHQLEDKLRVLNSRMKQHKLQLDTIRQKFDANNLLDVARNEKVSSLQNEVSSQCCELRELQRLCEQLESNTDQVSSDSSSRSHGTKNFSAFSATPKTNVAIKQEPSWLVGDMFARSNSMLAPVERSRKERVIDYASSRCGQRISSIDNFDMPANYRQVFGLVGGSPGASNTLCKDLTPDSRRDSNRTPNSSEYDSPNGKSPPRSWNEQWSSYSDDRPSESINGNEFCSVLGNGYFPFDPTRHTTDSLDCHGEGSMSYEGTTSEKSA